MLQYRTSLHREQLKGESGEKQFAHGRVIPLVSVFHARCSTVKVYGKNENMCLILGYGSKDTTKQNSMICYAPVRVPEEEQEV